MDTHLPPEIFLTLRDIRLDEVDSGAPRLTLLEPGTERVLASVRLAPDAVTALVDALAGVAEPARGEARVFVKVRAEDVVRLLRADLVKLQGLGAADAEKALARLHAAKATS